MKAALINAALVGSGGFVGAICRYGLSGLVQRNAVLSAFPYGTLAVNLLGCLLIGIVCTDRPAWRIYDLLNFRLRNICAIA